MKRTGVEKIICNKTKKERFIRNNAPLDRKFGQAVVRCKICGGRRGHLSKYNLDICRRCFREVAKELGFRKLR